MAAPRSIQFIALRNLARHGSQQQVRKLHMTGPATYASPVLTNERSVLNLPRDIAGLRAECKRRRIDIGGTQQDLVARINADETASSRAFSTAVQASKRPTAEAASSSSADQEGVRAVRHFNTSRALKSVNDTSTIDFAFLPASEPEESIDLIRVPLLHHNYTPNRTGVHSDEAISEPMVIAKPMISSVASDSVILPMSEMHDDHGLGIDFHGMADRVAANMRKMRVPVEEQASLMKQIWSDMVDDVVGVAKKPATA
ncbi:hypothetical protein K431DRAFT_109367 [Polychaeton citri CBS 116435]|uniref:SAP domain-containing protein n=1 Tax=Polychaeton citri CBS 116435 TaxID=1314669 RepID=A0A9P4Q2Q1_9PEZI|nr:hypothetical protein K431DRAFT_109367 [Polychaeton citri CBS 116435]